MRKFATLLAVVMAAVFSAGVIVAADAPEKITIKVIQKEKSAVEFGHKVHADKVGKCAECHHKDEAGKEQKCSGCHKPKMEKEKESFKEVMHTKCKGCHQKEKKGPTKCEGCHPKK